MSKKFTGITSAGSAIPVYDKDAHSALEQKLDTSAFSSVSGEFATIDDVVAAVSGKADTSAIPSLDGYATEEWVGEQGYLTEVPESAVSGLATHEEVESATSGKFDASAVSPLVNSILANTVEYRSKPSSGEIYAARNTLYNVNSIGGESINVQSSQLYIGGAITATTDGVTAGGLTANSNSSYGGFTANGVTANTGGFSANGLSAGKRGPLWIQGETEVFSAGGGAGFTFSSVNTGIGTAQLTTAGPNQTVQMYSPKFEARNVSGAGFSIEASGARGYDHAGNVVWDTSVIPPANNLIGYYDSKASAGGLTGDIILTVGSKSNTGSLTSMPYTIINGDGMTATYGPTAYVPSIQIKPDNITMEIPTGSSARAKFGIYVGGAQYENSVGTWSLTGSVQKREIECDSATSAITAIAGSAIGGGGATYSAGANIDITDDVISGKDWSEDIVAATSGLQPSGDYLSASESANFYPMSGNPSGFLTEHQSLDGLMQTSGLEYDGDKISGYMGSAFKAGTDLEFEYDSADNISAINSSAISTTPSQALYAKSPLYAGVSGTSSFIGINSADLARMLGVDETVLYSGIKNIGNAGTATYNLNESPMNFKTIKVLWCLRADTIGDIANKGVGSFEFEPDQFAQDYTYVHAVMNGANTTDTFTPYDIDTNINNIKTSAWNVISVIRNVQNNGEWFHIYSIIGIGRKEA